MQSIEEIKTTKSVQLSPVDHPVQVVYTGRKVELPKAVHHAINQHWDSLIEKGKSFSRGGTFTVQQESEGQGGRIITLALTDYAHYLATIHNMALLQKVDVSV